MTDALVPGRARFQLPVREPHGQAGSEYLTRYYMGMLLRYCGWCYTTRPCTWTPRCSPPSHGPSFHRSGRIPSAEHVLLSPDAVHADSAGVVYFDAGGRSSVM